MSVNTDIKEEAPNLIDLINEGFTSSIVQLDYRRQICGYAASGLP